MDDDSVIIPPPELKAVVDKTAAYVASVGTSFEAKLYAREKNNPKFAFLMPSSHYHAYYKQQVAIAKSTQETGAQSQAAQEQQQQRQQQTHQQQQQEWQQQRQADLEEADRQERLAAGSMPKVPEIEPPSERRFEVPLPPGISAQDYDIVRLVARFVAINGPAFNQALYMRESQNPSFAFLVDQAHPHRQLFLELTRQYELVIERIGKDVSSELSLDRAVLLDKIVRRTEFERNVRAKKAAMERGKKQGAGTEESSNLVDWDDFVVVQVLTLDDDVSTLAEPVTLAQLKMAPALAAANAKLSVLPPPVAAVQKPGLLPSVVPQVARPSQQQQLQQQQQQQQQQLLPQQPSPASQQPFYGAGEEDVIKPILQSKPVGVQVVQNYTPGGAGAVQGASLETHQRCPICSQLIPISQMEQHMKIETMSKKHLEHLKEASIGKKSAMAPDDEIAANITAFSKIRTDIFDHRDVEPEELIEQRKKRKLQQKTIWDGHQETADGAMNLEDQIRMIHATKGSDVVHDNPNIGPVIPQRRVSAAPQVVIPPPQQPPLQQGPYATPPGISGGGSVGSVMSSSSNSSSISGGGGGGGGVQVQVQGVQGVQVQMPPGVPGFGLAGVSYKTGAGQPLYPPPGTLGGAGLLPPPGMMGGMAAPASHGYSQPASVQPQAPPPQLLQLIDENEWAESHPLSFEIRVIVPLQDNDKGWRLDGSTLSFAVKLNQSVDSVKTLVERAISLPAKLQKLKQAQRGVLKDGKSLAAYNFTEGDVLELDVSKRGGKK